MPRGYVTLLVIVFIASGGLVDASEAQTGASSTATAAGGRPDIENVLVEGASEWTAAIATGWGVGRRLESDDSSYAFGSLSWGKVLTAPVGPDVIRGRFEWALEVIPIFGQYHPDGAYGVGVSPLVWRWNLERRGPMAPYGEVGGGGLWTNHAVPAGTSGGNFTAHVSVGIRMLTSTHRGVVLAYRFDHISNGNRVDRNPGVNAHVVYFGLTTFRSK